MIQKNNIDHGYAIANAAGCLLNPASDIVISRSEGYKLLGGVIFTDYTGKSISIHVAGFAPHWVNRDMLWVTMHYPFVQLGCSSMFAQIRSSNKQALDFAINFGFNHLITIPDVFPEADLVLFRLYAQQAERWLRLKPRSLTLTGNDQEAA